MKFVTHFLNIAIIIVFSIGCTKDKVRSNLNTPPPLPPPDTQAISSRIIIDASLIPVSFISQARSQMAVAAAGNKIILAGGIISPDNYSSRVDIYDITTNTWTIAELNEARTGIATAVLNNKIYFAGGKTKNNQYSSVIDIYNTETNEWKTFQIDKKESLLVGAAAINKVVFAGGEIANIFDETSNTWSYASLSERPGSYGPSVEGITATVIGETIFFAGGIDNWEVQKAIDIYNVNTNIWSKSSLSEYKGFAAGIAVDKTNYWAGGHTYTGIYTLSNFVELRDMTTGAIIFNKLFQPNASFSAVKKNNLLIFFTGEGNEKNKFDIYNTESKSWSIGLLTDNIYEASIITVNDIIYVAGGKVNGMNSNLLRKLEF
jgi:hypothetical protein